ncbi:MAG: alkaline phosphatase family protein [Chloroflexia bacterium]
MINQASVKAVQDAQWTPHFIRPLYDSYCFAQIPGLIPGLLGGAEAGGMAEMLLGPLAGTYDKLILTFVDAFGWRFWQRYAERYPFLRRIAEEGVATKLTSQFPSTTAAHSTTIHTGLPVGQSGVYEWFYYEPLVDEMIAPLLFSFAGDKDRNTLRPTRVPPADFFPRGTFYHGLRRQGITPYIFQHEAYTPSPFGDAVMGGTEMRPYRDLPSALGGLTSALLAERERSYYFFYYGEIDTVGHKHGPNSPQFEAAVDDFFTLMESAFYGPTVGHLGKTLLLITADHGLVETDPATTVYLNLTLPELTGLMQTNAAGRPLVPGGSARDMFLHIEGERLAEAQAMLREHLSGKADVYPVSELIAQGFFGSGEPSAAFMGRVGNLVVLPYAGESVWWHESGRFSQDFYGHHGGLTRAEMETLLLGLRL